MTATFDEQLAAVLDFVRDKQDREIFETLRYKTSKSDVVTLHKTVLADIFRELLELQWNVGELPNDDEMIIDAREYANLLIERRAVSVMLRDYLIVGGDSAYMKARWTAEQELTKEHAIPKL